MERMSEAPTLEQALAAEAKSRPQPERWWHSLQAESTRRALTEAQQERQAPRAPRRAAAQILQRAAHRLDPYVTSPPRVTLGR